IVRAPQDDLTATKKILEMGVDGIIFPMIKTAEEAILYNNLYKYFITSNFDNTHFRIGCSQLFEKIKEKLS
ncbi:MAG: hypothetical protein UH077_00595, partial [Bacteroidales bacterium]|nr:hypothetical protein [Bacteroidales bacterium]